MRAVISQIGFLAEKPAINGKSRVKLEFSHILIVHLHVDTHPMISIEAKLKCNVYMCTYPNLFSSHRLVIYIIMYLCTIYVCM